MKSSPVRLVGPDGARVSDSIRSGSARRFATPVEPPPFPHRCFVSLSEDAYSLTSVTSNGSGYGEGKLAVAEDARCHARWPSGAPPSRRSYALHRNQAIQFHGNGRRGAIPVVGVRPGA